MEGEKTHPASSMNRVLVRMLASPGDLVGDVVDRDDGIEERYDDEEQQAEREIVEKQ